MTSYLNYKMSAQKIIQGDNKERTFVKLEPKPYKNHRFEFPSHELAFQVREVVYLKLIQFDKNEDEEFQEQQIRDFLVSVLNENENQIHYFVKNVFRYDSNNDGKIEYDELVNFCTEQHFGEIAIQRLHRKKLYERGSQRVMNLKQFNQTIKYALSFIEFAPQDEDIRMAFEIVDADKDGYLSYEDYFRFLKEYFGSKSVAAKMVNKRSVLEEMKNSRGQERDQMPEEMGPSIIRKYSKPDQSQNHQLAIAIVKDHQNVNNNSKEEAKIVTNPIASDPILQSSTTITSVDNYARSIVNSNVNSNLGQNSTNPNHLENNAKSVVNPNANINLAISQHTANISSTENTGRINTQSQNSNSHQLEKKPKIQITISQRAAKKEARGQISLSQPESILAERIARMVMSQLKVILIDFDFNQDCQLSTEDIFKFMRNLYRSDLNQGDILKRSTLSRDRTYSYEQSSKIVIRQHIFRVVRSLQENRTLNQQQFVGQCDKVCSIVKNTPLISKYQTLYQLRTDKGFSLTVSDTEQLLLHIFNNYPRNQ